MSNLTTRDPSSDSPNIIDAAWSFFSGRACSLARFAPYMSLKVSKILLQFPYKLERYTYRNTHTNTTQLFNILME